MSDRNRFLTQTPENGQGEIIINGSAKTIHFRSPKLPELLVNSGAETLNVIELHTALVTLEAGVQVQKGAASCHAARLPLDPASRRDL